MLYDSRNKFYNMDFSFELELLETLIKNQDTQIAFSHCIFSVREKELNDSMLGNFYFDSPLSYHLHVSYKVLSNIKNGLKMVVLGCKREINFNLPMYFLPLQS